MAITSIGDMASHMMNSRRTTAVKNDLNRLAYELGSGRKADVAASLKGDFNMLAGVERQLTVLQGYDIATKDAQLFLETAQATLGQIHTVTGDLGRDLLSASESGLSASVVSVAKSARNDFDAIVSALNGRVADRSLFGGTATDGAALVDASTMMTQISAAVAGSATISDIVTAVDDYFMAPGGGFETGAYIGSTNDLAPMRLNDNQSADFNVRADTMELREAMRDSALAALALDPGLNLDLLEQKQLMETAGERLLTGQDNLTSVRADVGFNQERVENVMAENSLSRSSMLMTQSDLIGADQTEVAGKLQAVQVQLEMVYTITARLSQLTLANYVR
jgi:flagellar hook-associated protein 3 FlgL